MPRSPFAEVGGYPWLGRLIDKVRTEQQGVTGDYTPFPSGIDVEFIAQLGLEAEELREVIAAALNDGEVVSWVVTHQAPSAHERMAAFRQALTRPCPARYADELAEEIADRAAAYPDIDFSRATNFVHVICLEEGHAWPAGGPS